MKTIEEAINEISNLLLSGMDKESYTKDEIGDMFDRILMYVHSLPLSDRLRADEREKIKAEYATTPSSRAKAMLMRIFGKAMFAEEGGEE